MDSHSLFNLNGIEMDKLKLKKGNELQVNIDKLQSILGLINKNCPMGVRIDIGNKEFNLEAGRKDGISPLVHGELKEMFLIRLESLYKEFENL